MNDKNLIANENRTPEERRENARKAGKASGEARRRKRTVREIAEYLDSLPVTGEGKELLASLGLPDDIRTQETLRLVALHQKAITGDVRAIRLWLEITGEAPSQKVEVYAADDKTREAYERAAAAIRGKKD